MDWKLQLVTVPVADIDRAKACYADRLGFAVLTDTRCRASVRRRPGARAGPGTARLQLVRVLRRPRRQRLSGAGGGPLRRVALAVRAPHTGAPVRQQERASRLTGRTHA